MKIDPKQVEEAAKTLYIRALKVLPPDIKSGFQRLDAAETDATGKSVLATMIRNIQVAEADDVALMHTDWTISGPETRQVHAIEVARRNRDGTWRWLIGDPFTIGRAAAGRSG